MGSKKQPVTDTTPATPLETDETPAPIDVHGPEPVLFYTGEGPIYGEAPARDLTGADLARLVRINELKASGGVPVKPATQGQLQALVAQLTSSGAFSPSARNDDPQAPAAPAAPAKEN